MIPPASPSRSHQILETMAKVSLPSFILSGQENRPACVLTTTATFHKTRGVYLLPTAVEATIKFTYIEKYPDEPPLWEIHSQENLEDGDAEDVLTLLQQQVRPHDHGVFLPKFLIKSPHMLLRVELCCTWKDKELKDVWMICHHHSQMLNLGWRNHTHHHLQIYKLWLAFSTKKLNKGVVFLQ